MAVPSPSAEQEAAHRFIRGLFQSLSPAGDDSLPAEPNSFVSLSDGRALSILLSRCAPHAFRESAEGAANVGERGRVNRPLRKERLRTLLNDMNAFANSAELRGATASRAEGAVTIEVDIHTVSSSATLMGLEGDLNDESADEVQAALEQLGKLTTAAIALIVLSGAVQPQVSAVMAALPPDSSRTLQNAVRDFALHHHLTPRDTSGEGASPPQQDVSAPEAGVPSFSTHADPTHTGHDHRHGAVRQTQPSLDSSAATGVAALGADDSYFRNATVQLRRELEEVKTRLADAEWKLSATQESEASWERRYRMLLEEQATATTAEQTSSSSAAGSPNSGPRLSDLRQRLASKEEAIQSLSKKVEEQASMLKAFKEATVAQEQGLLAMKRKLKSTEEALMVKAAERREALERVSIAEDKLAIQVKAKLELENEVEELRSQVTVLRLTQQHRREGGEGDEAKLLNSSFASNGSVDRVIQLENELDEARAQRGALQKQLFILQTQLTSIAVPTADVGAAANDTLKAQIRHLEREREQLQQQLAMALGRVEELQSSRGAVAGVGPRSLGVNPNTAHPSSSNNDPSASNTGLLSQTGRDDDEGGGDPGSGGGSADLRELSGRLRKLRDETRREHVVMSSLLLQYGYRNLMLQQHQILLHEDHKAAEESAARAHREGPGGFADGGHAEGGVHEGGTSFHLARQRLEVEQGLLESILHCGRAANRKRRETLTTAAEVTAASLIPSPSSAGAAASTR